MGRCPIWGRCWYRRRRRRGRRRSRSVRRARGASGRRPICGRAHRRGGRRAETRRESWREWLRTRRDLHRAARGGGSRGREGNGCAKIWICLRRFWGRCCAGRCGGWPGSVAGKPCYAASGERQVRGLTGIERRYNSGYTTSMKTAVSLPDELFRQADAAARRMRVSRSHLFASAIAEFLDRRRSDAVTERLNAIHSRHPAKVDAALHRAQLRSLDRDSW